MSKCYVVELVIQVYADSPKEADEFADAVGNRIHETFDEVCFMGAGDPQEVEDEETEDDS